MVELHGSLLVWRCTKTGKEEVRDEREAFDVYPMVSDDGGLMRPGVVWFGEVLPEEAVRKADEVVSECDVFMSVGTSGVVYPAAGYVSEARMRGAKTVEINLEETPLSAEVDWSVRGRCEEVLKAVVDRMG